MVIFVIASVWTLPTSPLQQSPLFVRMSMASTWQVSQPTIIPLCSMSTHRPVAGHDVAALGNSYRDFHLSFQLYRSILRSILCCCTIISDIPRHIRFLDFISLSDKAETTIGCSLWSLLKSKQTACICNQSRAEAKMLVLVYF